MQRIVYNRFSIQYIEFKNLNMIEKKKKILLKPVLTIQNGRFEMNI